MKSRVVDYSTLGIVGSFYQGKVIVVSGASGFLGSNLVTALSSLPCSIVRLTRNKNRLQPINIASNIIDIEGDYQQPETWRNLTRDVDIVFHLAAQTSVYRSEEDVVFDYESNVSPMTRLLESCMVRGHCPTVIFSGSATQCGLPDSLPTNEETKDKPVTTYDTHKLMAENQLKESCKSGIIFGTSLRLCSVFGPGPQSSNIERGVLNKMIRKALDGEVVELYGNGSILRDFLFIDDVISAFLLAPIHIDRVTGQHFNVASGESYSLREVADRIASVVKKKRQLSVNIKCVPPPFELSPIEARNDFVQSDKYRKATGWHPLFSLTEGLEITVENQN